MPSAAVEDYLKALWTLGASAALSQVPAGATPDVAGQVAAPAQPPAPARAWIVPTHALARRLGVTPASATGMVRRLAAQGLANYERYRGATLTRTGQREALRVVRRHRLLEAFLSRTLALGWEEVHDEAERLEHDLSPELEASIAATLGFPLRDPHGHPIPGPDGSLPRMQDAPLTEWPLELTGVVSQVDDHDPAVLTWVRDHGLTPGEWVAVLAHEPLDGGLRLRVAGGELTVGATVAQALRVAPEATP